MLHCKVCCRCATNLNLSLLLTLYVAYLYFS